MVWLCTKCRDPGKTEAASRIEAKLDNVLKMLAGVMDRMDGFERKHSACSEEVIEKKIMEAVEVKVDEFMTEMVEKDKRKLNVVIANLPESELETPEERKKEDRDRVRKLVGKIADDVKVDEIDNPVRLGPVRVGTNAKPRLLKMTVKSEETKKKIMRNVSKLNINVPLPKRVYINDDTTPKEREKIRKLKEEIRDRRETEPNLTINYRELKIVTRQTKHTTTTLTDTQKPNQATAQSVAGTGTDQH